MLIEWEEITVGSDCKTGFFAFSHAEYQVDYEADERDGRNDPPQGLLAGGTEIFLGHVDNGPYGAHKEGYADSNEDYSCFNTHI